MSEQPQQFQIPPQFAPQFAPQPLPMAWACQGHPSGHVSLTIFDASGQRVIILEHADAQKLVNDIAGQIPVARSGLIVPGALA